MLHHVSLEVLLEDLPRFEELLGTVGFRPTEAPAELGEGVRWYASGGTQIHLIITPAASAPVLGHAAFVAPSFEQTVARLRDGGFEVEEARQLWGARRAFVITPGGHRLELMAHPPG